MDAFNELKKDLGLVVLVDGDEVFLFELFGRMGQFLGKVAVVGENEEAFGVEVEAADMFEMMILVGKQVVDGLPIAIVALGADHSTWFVKGYDKNVSAREDLAAETDGVIVGNADGGSFANGPVDAHFAFLNLAIGFPTGKLGAGGNELVEANFFHWESNYEWRQKSGTFAAKPEGIAWGSARNVLNQERGIKLRL